MNKESLEMTLCLMLFTYLCVIMNDVVMLHRIDLVMDCVWRNMHDYECE
jgi:hypothetical protein